MVRWSRMSSWSRKTLWSRMTTRLSALLAALVIGGLSLPVLAQPAVQPEITSQKDAQRTVEEYRINGKLYAIRVTPKSGGAYFLYDDDGDGDFKRVETPSVPVPKWVQNE